MVVIHRNYSQNREKGNIGEDIAFLFLMKHGFKVLERNHLKPWGEIDIITEKNRIIRFVEVKSVSCEIDGGSVSRETLPNNLGYAVARETLRPEEHMTGEKGKRLKRVITTYLREKNFSHETLYQLDLVTVRFNQRSKIALVEFFEKII